MSTKLPSRVFLLGNLSSYGCLFIQTITAIISVAVGLKYFGATVYGIWLVMFSIVGYFNFANFGITLSARNKIAHTSDVEHQRRILKQSLILLSVSSIAIITILFLVISVSPNWIGILGKIPLDMKDVAAKATLAMVILFLIRLPIRLFGATFSALQEIHWEKFYAAVAAIARLGALFLTIWRNGDLLTLALFVGLSGLIVNLISSVHLFISHPSLFPRIERDSPKSSSYKALFLVGLRFLNLQISTLIIMNTGNVIISHYLGPKEVTPYAVSFKLFWMGIQAANMIGIVLWPMYAKAKGEGRWDWINRVYNMSTVFLMSLAGALWVGGIIFAGDIIRAWAGAGADGGLLLMFALGGYGYMAAYAGSGLSVLNALDPTKIQVLIGWFDAVLNIIISLVLIKPLGIAGVGLATFISITVAYILVPSHYVSYRTNNRVKLQIGPAVKHSVVVVLPFILIAIFTKIFINQVPHSMAVRVLIFVSYFFVSWRVLPRDVRSRIQRFFRYWRKVCKTIDLKLGEV